MHMSLSLHTGELAALGSTEVAGMETWQERKRVKCM